MVAPANVVVEVLTVEVTVEYRVLVVGFNEVVLTTVPSIYEVEVCVTVGRVTVLSTSLVDVAVMV